MVSDCVVAKRVLSKDLKLLLRRSDPEADARGMNCQQIPGPMKGLSHYEGWCLRRVGRAPQTLRRKFGHQVESDWTLSKPEYSSSDHWEIENHGLNFAEL